MAKLYNTYDSTSHIRGVYVHAKRSRINHCSICSECRLVRIKYWNSPDEHGTATFSGMITKGTVCNCGVTINSEIGEFHTHGPKLDELTEELLDTIELLYC